MGKARSDDLRERVVEAVAAGASRRAAAARFKVGVSSAIRWVTLQEETGSISQRPRGGKSRSPLKAHEAWLLELSRQENDLTLVQICQRLLDERGLKITDKPIRNFFKRHRITLKKNSARQRADAARRGRSARLVEGHSAGS